MAFLFYLSSVPFEFARDVCAKVNSVLKRRPSSRPFLSGDTYRKLADFIFDETNECSAGEINAFRTSKIDAARKHPLVFVSSWKLESFYETVMAHIQIPFVLLTHQGDVNIQTEFHKKILNDKNLIHWFAQNCLLVSEKITPLPIGLEDKWRHNNGALRDFKNKKYRRKQKQPKIIFGFSINTNPESRVPCFTALCTNKNATQIYQAPTSHLYRRKLASHMFVASPAGNGLDCHRTWEALYFGVIPIAEKNTMNEYFKSLGLPLVLIEKSEWKNLSKWTPCDMEKTFREEWSKADEKPLWLEYWIEKINQYVT